MTVLNLQIGASTDDTREATPGGASVTDATVAIFTNNGEWAGLRFQNVTVPQGATINAATLQVYCFNGTYDDPAFDIWGYDADDCSAFDGTSSEVSDKATTTASVSSSDTGIGVGWYSEDVTSIIAEIVARGGWSSGNSLILALESTGTSFRFSFYDRDSAEAAKLDINYTAAGGSSVPVLMRSYQQRRS